MNLRNHIEELKKFTPAVDLEGVNKIYFLEVKEKPGLVKIGDTHRTVEERNSESIINAALHPIRPATFFIAEKENGSVFRDKSFHTFLTKKGFKREPNHKGTPSEWFYIDLETAIEIFAEFVKKPVYKVVQLRNAQQYALDKFQETVVNGYRYVNFGGCVRIGKTIISLTHAANNGAMPVYIGKNLTSQNSAEADNEEFGIVPELLTQSLHGIDEETDEDLSRKARRIIENIDAANTGNKQIIFYIDEVDDASHTKKSRAVITPVIKHYEKLGKMFQVVTMSGTRVYRGAKVLKELTNGHIEEFAVEYYEMQILQPKTTVSRNYTHISYYAKDEDGLANISDAMKNHDSGHKSLATAIEKLLGTNSYGYNVNSEFPHWFIKFATVGKNNANKLVSYLNRNHSLIENREYHYAVINGDETNAKESQDYCKRIIDENANKVCVFITQGMATTSFSVKSIGNTVVFTDNELTADDIQALHRSATWDDGKVDCNMIVVTTNDSMEHSFDDIFEDETKAAHSREDKIEIYRELLNNNSMVHITTNGSSVRPVRVTHDNVEHVIDRKAKAMTKVASLMNVVYDLDEEIVDNILEAVTGKKNTSRKSKSTRGEDFDPFGLDKKKKQRKLSDTMSKAAQEKILRAFVENAVMVPAVAREQETSIEEFEFWEELGVDQELFMKVYNSSWVIKDRMDTIYSLCRDEDYLVETYINKLAA